MAKIIIFGSTGLLGKTLYDKLNQNHTLFCPSRDMFPLENVSILTDLEQYVYRASPDVIINCVGVLPGESIKDSPRAYFINSVFPKFLSLICKQVNARLLHFSTNCVFKGEENKNCWYTHSDIPNEIDVYGRSKALGEVPEQITIRTSFIGTSNRLNDTGLLEWFLRNKSIEVNGYDVVWNGISTLDISDSIDILMNLQSGIYHMACDKGISKYELLTIAKEVFNKDVIINPAHGGGNAKLLFPDITMSSNWKEKLIRLKKYKETGEM